MAEATKWIIGQDEEGNIHVLPRSGFHDHEPTVSCSCNPVVDITSKSRGGGYIIRHKRPGIRRVK